MLRQISEFKVYLRLLRCIGIPVFPSMLDRLDSIITKNRPINDRLKCNMGQKPKSWVFKSKRKQLNFQVERKKNLETTRENRRDQIAAQCLQL